MNNPLNFRAGAAASLNQIQAARGISAPPAPTSPSHQTTATRPGEGLRPGATSASPVHMAAEEMERHVSEAIEDSPVLKDDQAPIIDTDHLDNPPVQDDPDDIDLPEGEPEDDFEPTEFQEVEVEEEEETESRSDEDEGGGSEAGESDRELLAYIAEELKVYQRDKVVPAKRQARLLKDRDGRNDRPGPAALAAACESAFGGLARTLPGMPGDFIGLVDQYRGKLVGVHALTNPANLQGFMQELKRVLERGEVAYLLLDISRIPAPHQAQVLKNLPAVGAKPQRVMMLLGAGRKQWN